jgi:hypothetical protein
LHSFSSRGQSPLQVVLRQNAAASALASIAAAASAAPNMRASEGGARRVISAWSLYVREPWLLACTAAPRQRLERDLAESMERANSFSEGNQQLPT